MSMDFETVRFLRVLFAVIFAIVGGAAGIKYYGPIGAAAGIAIGAIFGYNAVDLFKGRAKK
jgi:hypothetical protein